MEITAKPFDIYEIFFKHPSIDKVHVEAMCRIMRERTDIVDLAAHFTDHGRMVMRLKLSQAVIPSEDAVKKVVQQAADECKQRVRTLIEQLAG
jgi:hypothetical protein